MVTDVVLSDRERGFADWGQTVVLRRVSQSFDPTTGTVAEMYDDQDVRAIVSDAELAVIVGTAGQAGRFDQMFLVRSEDVEQESNLRVMRIVFGGRQHRIDDVDGWPQARLVLLKCNRV